MQSILSPNKISITRSIHKNEYSYLQNFFAIYGPLRKYLSFLKQVSYSLYVRIRFSSIYLMIARVQLLEIPMRSRVPAKYRLKKAFNRIRLGIRVGICSPDVAFSIIRPMKFNQLPGNPVFPLLRENLNGNRNGEVETKRIH